MREHNEGSRMDDLTRTRPWLVLWYNGRLEEHSNHPTQEEAVAAAQAYSAKQRGIGAFVARITGHFEVSVQPEVITTEFRAVTGAEAHE